MSAKARPAPRQRQELPHDVEGPSEEPVELELPHDVEGPSEEPVELELPHGLGVCPLVVRRYQPQPVRFVVAAADDAETELGEPADLIVVAVPEGRHAKALEVLREALARPAGDDDA